MATDAYVADSSAADPSALDSEAAGGFFSVVRFVLFLGALVISLGWYVTDLRGGFNLRQVVLTGISAERGESIFWGTGRVNGTCATCHKVGSRGSMILGPTLGAGLLDRAEQSAALRRAAGAAEIKTAIDFLVESMTDPNVFVPEGRQAIMPAVQKPPAALEADHIKSLVLYLASIEGKAIEPDEIALPEDVVGSVPEEEKQEKLP